MGTKENPGRFDCYERAAPDEPMFVLLGRDPSASLLVNLWAELREVAAEDPEKIAEARDCANALALYATKLGKGDRVCANANAALDEYRSTVLRLVLAHVEEELGYDEGEPSTERMGRWTFTAGAAALSELRDWLLAEIGGAE